MDKFYAMIAVEFPRDNLDTEEIPLPEREIHMWKKRVSTLDRSVNFIQDTKDGGAFECRYVRRDESYFIAYVSSHTGCRLACRFCHLTQSGSTTFTPATAGEILGQVARVLEWHRDSETPAPRMNINFMARGDAMSNPFITGNFREIGDGISAMAANHGLDHRINISTIFPEESSESDLVTSFSGHPVTFFWSLYSLDPVFRRRWMPRAEGPAMSLRRLMRWQDATGEEVVLHWALIEGKNDDEKTLTDIAEMVVMSGLRARLNLVRYNSWSERTGQEPDDAGIARAMAILEPVMMIPGSRIVPRVGQDVAASCGMFMTAGAL